MNTFSPVEVLQDCRPQMKAQEVSPELIVAAQDVLLQGLGLLFELGDRMYSHVTGTPFNASVGQHYRHVLEHFQSLIRGLHAGEINYDARERNQRLQSDVTYASIATCDVLRGLKQYTNETLARDCKVINSVGYSASPPSRLDSNVSRELAHCIGRIRSGTVNTETHEFARRGLRNIDEHSYNPPRKRHSTHRSDRTRRIRLRRWRDDYGSHFGGLERARS